MKILLLLAVLSCIIGTAECVDGKWGKWSKWSLCSLKCGGGIKERTRVCNNPAPSDGGRACGGGATGTVKCNTAPCRTVVDGGFSEWFDWGKCSKKCGSGTMTRWRACNNPKPMRGGKQCEGANTASQACNTQGCPVNGRYAEWSRWGDCSTTCGGGELTRTRTCTNPAPANGGKDCVGVASLSRACNKHACQAGGLSDWSAWGQCNSDCGGGTQSRTRACDSPAPAYGGADCSGDLEEAQNCNEEACPSPTKADVNLAQLPMAPQVWPGPDHRLHLKLNIFGTPDTFQIIVIFNSPTMGTVKLALSNFLDSWYIGYNAYDLAGKLRPGMTCTHDMPKFPSDVVASPHSKEAWLLVDGEDEDGSCLAWLDFFVDTFMPTVTTWTIDNTRRFSDNLAIASFLDISYMIDGGAEEGSGGTGDLEKERPSPTKADVNLAQLPLAPQVWPGPDHNMHLKLNLFGSPKLIFEIAVIFNSPTIGTVDLELSNFLDKWYIAYHAYDLAGKERPGMTCTHDMPKFPSDVVASPHSKEAWLLVDGEDEDGSCLAWLDFFVDTFMPTVTTWTIDNVGRDSWLSSEELAKILDISYMIDN